MISVFFVPGMFGSTVEYMLREFSNNFTNPELLDLSLQPDGSVHGFAKSWHPLNMSAYDQNIDVEIATPIYPTRDGTLSKILETYPFKSSGKNILMYADSLRAAELNLLFQYHKIAVGQKRQLGLETFAIGNECDIVKWNSEYTHWSQMQPWEWREWMSLFYVTYVQQWINSQHEAPDSFLKVSTTELLFQTKDAITRIFDFCNTQATGNIDLFINEWVEKQQYVITEFNLLDEVVDNTINNIAFNWKELNIVAASIVQQRLRTLGYEIKCDSLNTFPSDSESLYGLLEKG